MLDDFVLNGRNWRVKTVASDDPMLIDRTGKRTVATTDPSTFIIYLSDQLHGAFLIKVLLHELGHCVMVSYDLLDDIYRVVDPGHRVEAEEWICNLIADHGFKIFSTAYRLVGDRAWQLLPKELEKFVA